MKRITLALLTTTTTLLSQTTGCVIHDDRNHGGDDDGGGGGPIDLASISARWSLRNMSDGATTACPAGFDTVQLIAQPIDANGDATDEPYVDRFACGTRSGVMTDLPPDVYQTWIEVSSNDLARRYAQSLSQVLDVRVADARFDVDILNDGGFFLLSWDLVDKVTLRPLSCAATGAGTIRAISTSVADAHRIYDDLRPCDDHTTVTDGLLEGSYTITIDALAGDRPLGAAMTLTNKRITGQNGITDLGNILIPIAGM